MVRFVQNPYLTDENVDKEKGIIAQEIQMYLDNPSWVVFFNSLRAMYHNNPVRIDIAGSVESINEITKEDLETAYKTFYNPKNMVLFIVGDLEKEIIESTLKESVKFYENNLEEIVRIEEVEPKEINQKRIETTMLTSKPLFYIGFKDVDINLSGKELVKKDIITNIILDILFSESSEFYNELYSEGIIDSNFGAYFTGHKAYGHSLVVGQSDDPDFVHDRIMGMLKESKKYITMDSFERIKKKEIGHFLMGLNSIEFIANNLTELYFQDFILIDYIDVLNEIKFEDIELRFNEHFKEEMSVMSIIWLS